MPQALIIGRVDQAPYDRLGKTLSGRRIARSKISIDSISQPISDPSDIKSCSRQTARSSFRSDQAERLGPQTGDNQEVRVFKYGQ